MNKHFDQLALVLLTRRGSSVSRDTAVDDQKCWSRCRANIWGKRACVFLILTFSTFASNLVLSTFNSAEAVRTIIRFIYNPNYN